MVSIPACHAGDPGSIPGLGAFLHKFGVMHSKHGRIAQSVERWSNKPLVMGSSPIVTIF